MRAVPRTETLRRCERDQFIVGILSRYIYTRYALVYDVQRARALCLTYVVHRVRVIYAVGGLFFIFIVARVRYVAVRFLYVRSGPVGVDVMRNAGSRGIK